jgi:SSS family solute:Na+ symporter
VSPGILAVFILGLFWKKTTNKATIWGILSIPIAMFFKVGPKSWAVGVVWNLFFNIAVDGSNGLYRYFDYVVDYCS